MNKSDLPSLWSAEERERFTDNYRCIETSALTGAGIEELRSEIISGVFGANHIWQDGIVVTNIRHCNYLEAAEVNLKKSGHALSNGLSEEFALVDLHAALRKLGAITGETTVDDLLEEIFSRFCIGK
jgi:tRNA modification GTPase